MKIQQLFYTLLKKWDKKLFFRRGKKFSSLFFNVYNKVKMSVTKNYVVLSFSILVIQFFFYPMEETIELTKWIYLCKVDLIAKFPSKFLETKLLRNFELSELPPSSRHDVMKMFLPGLKRFYPLSLLWFHSRIYFSI